MRVVREALPKVRNDENRWKRFRRLPALLDRESLPAQSSGPADATSGVASAGPLAFLGSGQDQQTLTNPFPEGFYAAFRVISGVGTACAASARLDPVPSHRTA